MKNEIIYDILSDTNKHALAQQYNDVVNDIDSNKYESIRVEYSTTFQAGGMKFGKVVHSILILATEK